MLSLDFDEKEGLTGKEKITTYTSDDFEAQFQSDENTSHDAKVAKFNEWKRRLKRSGVTFNDAATKTGNYLKAFESPDTVGMSLVGSTKIGRLLYKKCGEYAKRAQAQAGAKNFLTIMPDADIERTVPNLMGSFFGNSGQRCLSGAVLLAVGDVYEPIKQAVLEATKRLTVGNGLDEGIHMGPLATKTALERVHKYIELGIKEGAKLILDGRDVKVPDHPNGFFIGPSIFDEVTPEMTIAKEEIFGPVMSIIRVKEIDEAIEVIHSNPHGNASSIFTSSGKWAREYQYRVRAGNIGINIGVVAPIASFPFSGMKDSFFGDLHGQGRDAVDFFTENKVVITRWF